MFQAGGWEIVDEVANRYLESQGPTYRFLSKWQQFWGFVWFSFFVNIVFSFFIIFLPFVLTLFLLHSFVWKFMQACDKIRFYPFLPGKNNDLWFTFLTPGWREQWREWEQMPSSGPTQRAWRPLTDGKMFDSNIIIWKIDILSIWYIKTAWLKNCEAAKSR